MGGNSLGRLSDVLVFNPKDKTAKKVAEFPQVDVAFSFNCHNSGSTYAITPGDGAVMSLVDHFVKGACLLHYNYVDNEYTLLAERLE